MGGFFGWFLVCFGSPKIAKMASPINLFKTPLFSSIIGTIAEKYSFNKGESIDLYSLIKITDNEDFAIESNSENVSVITELDASVAGKYKVLYSVKDSDGIKVLKTISVEIIDKTQENPNTLIVAVIIASLLVILFVSAIVLLKVLKKRETK